MNVRAAASRRLQHTWFTIAVILTACLVAPGNTALAQERKPNILVIMGDDIGWFNPSVYHRGIMGYHMNSDLLLCTGLLAARQRQSCLPGG